MDGGLGRVVAGGTSCCVCVQYCSVEEVSRVDHMNNLPTLSCPNLCVFLAARPSQVQTVWRHPHLGRVTEQDRTHAGMASQTKKRAIGELEISVCRVGPHNENRRPPCPFFCFRNTSIGQATPSSTTHGERGRALAAFRDPLLLLLPLEIGYASPRCRLLNDMQPPPLPFWAQWRRVQFMRFVPAEGNLKKKEKMGKQNQPREGGEEQREQQRQHQAKKPTSIYTTSTAMHAPKLLSFQLAAQGSRSTTILSLKANQRRLPPPPSPILTSLSSSLLSPPQRTAGSDGRADPSPSASLHFLYSPPAHLFGSHSSRPAPLPSSETSPSWSPESSKGLGYTETSMTKRTIEQLRGQLALMQQQMAEFQLSYQRR